LLSDGTYARAAVPSGASTGKDYYFLCISQVPVQDLCGMYVLLFA
jgi:hypothetical protein